MNQNYLYPNQPPIEPLQTHFCFKCNWEGQTAQKNCPQCSRTLFSQTNVRIRGVALVFIGLFLSGFMGTIVFFVTNGLIARTKDPRSGIGFNGDETMLLLIYLIFGGVIAMGATATVAGIWQMVFGRRNRFLIWIFIALIILTMLAGAIFRGVAN